MIRLTKAQAQFVLDLVHETKRDLERERESIDPAILSRVNPTLQPRLDTCALLIAKLYAEIAAHTTRNKRRSR